MSDAPLAFITGGCRRVGAIIAAHFARAGYDLALHGNQDAQPDDGLMQVLNETGVRWRGFCADLKGVDAHGLIAQITDHFSRAPNVLINNASLFEYDDVETQDSDSLDAHMKVNFHSPVLLTKALIDVQENQPSIIQIIDQRVRNPNGDQLSYTLSKQALAESIRTQAKAYGSRARINGIAPGYTLAPDGFDPSHSDRIAQTMPLGVNSNPEDIAQAALYLSSSKAVTGQLLFVDGGAHLESYAKDFEFM